MSTTPQTLAQPPILTSIPRQVVAALCHQNGSKLPLAGTNDGTGRAIDGVRLLWAIAGNESSFGDNCTPRHEPAYDVGGYYYDRSAAVRKAVQQWGSDAACSYGPWQVMLINTQSSPEQIGSDPSVACNATVHYLTTYVLGFRKARTLAEILDTYNTGNWRERSVPTKYIHDGTNYYQNFLLPASS